MTVTVSDDIAIGEAEVKQELALALYASHKATIIQASDLSGLGFFEFQKLLRDRKIPQHYSIQDLEEDLKTINKLGQM